MNIIVMHRLGILLILFFITIPSPSNAEFQIEMGESHMFELSKYASLEMGITKNQKTYVGTNQHSLSIPSGSQFSVRLVDTKPSEKESINVFLLELAFGGSKIQVWEDEFNSFYTNPDWQLFADNHPNSTDESSGENFFLYRSIYHFQTDEHYGYAVDFNIWSIDGNGNNESSETYVSSNYSKDTGILQNKVVFQISLNETKSSEMNVLGFYEEEISYVKPGNIESRYKISVSTYAILISIIIIANFRKLRLGLNH